MKKELLRKIIGTVLSFASAVLVAICVLLLGISLVFSRPAVDFITSAQSYKTAVRTEVLDSLESYAIPGGLPTDFFEDKITTEQINADIARAVECVFSGAEFDCTALSGRLKSDILLYAEQNGIDPTAGEESAQESIDRLVSLCVSDYKNYTYSVLLRYVGRAGNALFPWVLVAALVLLVLSILLLIAVGKIGGGFYVRTGLSGGAVMVACLPVFVLLSRSVENLGLASESMFFLATRLIYSLLFLYLAVAVLILILGNIKYKRSRPMGVPDKKTFQ